MKQLLRKTNDMLDLCLSRFAISFANGAKGRICYYIFHQPKMPEALKDEK